MRGLARVGLSAALLSVGCARDAVRARWIESPPWRAHVIDGEGRGADGVRAGDLDADGWPDLVTPWEEAGEVRIYRNPGPAAARSPWRRVVVGRVESPEDALPLDVDADGRLDIVTAAEGAARTLYVHRRVAASVSPWDDSAWESRPVPASAGRGGWLCVEPYDGDELGSAFVAGGNAGAPVALIEAGPAHGDVEDWQLRELGAAGWAMSIEPADLDGDGDLDLLIADREGPGRGLRWLERPADGSTAGAAWRSHPLLASAAAVYFLDRSGLGADGEGVLWATIAPRHIERLELREGETRRRDRIELPPEVGVPKAVRQVDIDRDGEPDLAVSFEQAVNPKRGLVWLRATASGWEVRDVAGPRGVKFDRLLPLDLDGDGDIDLVTTEETRIGLVWYENPLR